METIKKEKVENPKAFPIAIPGDCVTQPNEGMTLRDYFAAKAMNGAMSDFNHWSALMMDYKNEKKEGESPREYASRIFYEMADAMLKQRQAIEKAL